MSNRPDMVSMRSPSLDFSRERHEAEKLALRRDLVLVQREKPRFYGQLVDMEWQPFKVAVSDSAADLARADDRADA
jgi:hypothetical protein